MSENWVDGTYESGDDHEANEPIEPTPDPDADQDGGVDMGVGEGSTFEPEEDTGAP